jgi:hypothetical protein
MANLIRNGKVDWEAVQSLPTPAAEAASNDYFTNWTVTYTDGKLELSCDVKQSDLALPLVLGALSAPDGTLYCAGAYQLFADSPVPNHVRMRTNTGLFDPKVHGNTVESLMLFRTVIPSFFYHERRTFTV